MGREFPSPWLFYALSLSTIRTIGRIISNKSFYKTKNEILSTILPLASKEGLRNLSLSQIAKNAGIAKSTLYSHFSSKDEMIDQLYLFIRKQAKERKSSHFFIIVSILEVWEQPVLPPFFRFHYAWQVLCCR